MKSNIKKGIFRIYLIIWVLWFFLGFSEFFNNGTMEIRDGESKQFLILAIIVPLVVLFATRWIVKGFENK